MKRENLGIETDMETPCYMVALLFLPPRTLQGMGGKFETHPSSIQYMEGNQPFRVRLPASTMIA